MAKNIKQDNKLNETTKIKAPIVDALKTAYENPTYQFHIPGHTKGKAIFKDFRKLIGEKALNIDINSDEKYISRLVCKAVLDKINTKEVNLIKTENFRYRITIHFTEEEYDCIKQAIENLKQKGVKSITFSFLVRSILYEKLKLVKIETFSAIDKDVA